MALGWKVQDVDGIARSPVRELVDHDAPRTEAACTAGGAVGRKDLRVAPGEREREAAA